MVNSPDELTGFLVALEFTFDGIKQVYGTIFPLNKANNYDVVKTLQEKISKKEKVTFNFASINEFDFFNENNSLKPLTLKGETDTNMPR